MTTKLDAQSVIAGVDRAHDRSTAQKCVFLLIHAVSLVVCAYIAAGGTIELPRGWSGQGWRAIDPVRAQIVLAVTALYALRLIITHFYLLQRRFAWSEALGLGFMILLFEAGLCVFAGGLARSSVAPLGWPDYMAVALVLIGSFLNTYSEVQRKHWKERSENKGKCYTGGLFGLSRHINYFGDCVLFTGWCLLTATPWTLVIPVLMAVMFISYHIPGLETYLVKQYGDEFKDYTKRTKKFVPFLY